MISIHLSERQIAQIHALAILDDKTMGEVVRCAVDSYVIQRTSAEGFEDDIAQALTRQEEVLRRLKDVEQEVRVTPWRSEVSDLEGGPLGA